MSHIALLSRNGSSPKRQAYLQQSVQDFFGELSWEGVQAPPPKAAPAVSRDSLEQLDQLASPTPGLESVGAFFDRFPWDGQPMVGGPVSEPGISLDAAVTTSDEGDDGIDDMTLDAFSDLF